MSEPDAITDVVELCALLQCLGFTVKSLDTSDTNLSQDGGGAPKTVVINCQSSGIHVVLESPAVSCSCPTTDPQNSGFWQVSGVAGGKQLDKESGSTLLRALPKPYRERLSKQLHDMIRSIRALNDIEDGIKTINKSASLVDLGSKSASIVDLINKSSSLVDLNKEGNKSASILELGTPEKRQGVHLKTQTPARYRSLDTLTKDGQAKLGENEFKQSLYRQSTYTVCSTPDSVRRRNKTSSPIQTSSHNLLDSLIEAEKLANNLRNKLAVVVREYMEEGKQDSSISSMLDVSKISVLKGPESKAQFASSPNLSGLSVDYPKSRLNRLESASTSNLAKSAADSIKSKLKRISPNLLKKKDSTTVAKEKGDGKSKLQCLLKPRIVTPVRTGKMNSEASPNLYSASKKKFSHVKSTIPRPTTKKE